MVFLVELNVLGRGCLLEEQTNVLNSVQPSPVFNMSLSLFHP